MRFLKYAGIGLGLQILFLILIGLISQFLHFSVLGDLAIGIYYPFIMLILRTGDYKGESGMTSVLVTGIVLEMFFYSMILGIVLMFIRRNTYGNKNKNL